MQRNLVLLRFPKPNPRTSQESVHHKTWVFFRQNLQFSESTIDQKCTDKFGEFKQANVTISDMMPSDVLKKA